MFVVNRLQYSAQNQELRPNTAGSANVLQHWIPYVTSMVTRLKSNIATPYSSSASHASSTSGEPVDQPFDRPEETISKVRSLENAGHISQGCTNEHKAEEADLKPTVGGHDNFPLELTKIVQAQKRIDEIESSATVTAKQHNFKHVCSL